MTSIRKTAIIIGALFLISYCGVFIGSEFSASILNDPDFLEIVYPNRTQVIVGVLIELINDIAVVGIAVILFPIFKKYREGIALGYVGLRIFEGVLFGISKISTLSLITLSQEYIAASAADASSFKALAVLALADRSWAGELATVFFILGALALYYLLFQSKILPRFISVWGFISAAMLIVAKGLGVPDLTQGFQPAMILYFPIVLNELFIAVWLIVKGFNSSAIAHGSAKPK